MVKLNWQDVYYLRVLLIENGVRIGDKDFTVDETLDFGAPVGTVAVEQLKHLVSGVMLMENLSSPQLAFYVFMTLRRPQTLNNYYPLINLLDQSEQKAFYKLASEVMRHSGFDCQVINKSGNNNASYTPDVAYFVAAQIAEVFFYRQDILEQLLAAKPHFWFYTSQESFTKNGGTAGGSFNGEKACIQLVVSRLFEGFNNPTPGAAPFLHEFGHMLDFLNAGGRGSPGTQGSNIHKSSGFLPGMRMTDGEIYKPEARELFLKGKRLELERYMRLYDGAPPTDPLPIGHPYVFQNDTEFIAGYLEMFFRNPHYLAAQNPDLFQAFVLTFGWDTRKAWAKDYPYYIDQNRGYYLSGKKPGKPGLTLPE